MNTRHFVLVLAAFAASLAAYAGRIVTDSVQSQVLGATVKYNIYLPNGFADSKTYPIVYLLHGLSDDYRAWRDKGHMQEVADELIESGEACEMIIVMPNAGGPDTHNTWNGYFNMPGWNYEDFFFQELYEALPPEDPFHLNIPSQTLLPRRHDLNVHESKEPHKVRP